MIDIEVPLVYNIINIMNKVNYEYRLSMGRGVSTKNN
jgi:hypothetical protein